MKPGTELDRRQFLALAAATGASLAWAGLVRRRPPAPYRERRDLYPEGVASGDPTARTVLLWTRRPFEAGARGDLRVEVAEDEGFRRLVASAKATVAAGSDWTCRVLVANLEPARVYWYRFVDPDGNASRVGRTLTAPADDDPRPVRFAFVSCQNTNSGAQNAYRRMIFDDERAPESERIGFVLHLGDFIYEIVWYPEDRPQGYAGRPLKDIVRYPHGEKIADFHVPTTLDDYRAVYRAYLHDPELQDARARWPFVCIWDNHEFSWNGWQSVQVFNGQGRPAQTRKVAANQAWFEYQPAAVRKASGPSLDRFDPPAVVDAPLDRFDDHGLGREPNNLAAIGSLTGYRAFRYGRHVELLVTDQRTYRSEDPSVRNEATAFTSADFPLLFPEEVLEILDGGRAYAGGNPPATIPFGSAQLPNFRKNDPPQTLLGAEQKRWFLGRLKASRATWKIWGNTMGTLDYRADPANIPPGLGRPWPGKGWAGFRPSDYSTAYLERAEIYGYVRDQGITGFATVSGDRHSFWAGLAAPSLPPKPFEPVGVAFVTGSVSSPGVVETLESGGVPDAHPLRPLYLGPAAPGTRPAPTVNLLLRHGVRSCLEYHRTGDVERARRESNRDLAPHLSFLDLGGQGFAIVRAAGDALECEFVCIERPVARSTAPDGGPVVYRVVHRAPLWGRGEPIRLEQRIVEGNPELSL